MPVVVQKYGGTSVADPDRIRAVAEHIARTYRQGNQVIVVVSAMGKTTDDLVRLANDVSQDPHGRELDMLLTAGERISMALLCMAIMDHGVHALSFTGSQAGIVTDTVHGRAKILEVKGDRIRDTIAAGAVAVVAGFQGISTARDITTLGRGGSDTTAVALAATLGAEVCEIYTDVSGVFTADPRVVPEARKLSRVSFNEMLEMAATGGKVLALRSVEFARNYNVPVHVRSSFTWEPGTWVVEEDPSMEEAIISGVTHDTSEAKITISQVADRPGVAASLFRALAEESVNVDMIVQNVSTAGHTDISFTVPRDDLHRGLTVMEKVAAEIEASGVTHDAGVARVTLIGAGMKTNPGVAAKMFEVLAREGVNIEMISTSSIRISCVVQEADVELAVRATARGLRAGERVMGVNVGVIGATGLVGQEMLRILEERSFPVDRLRVYASARSEGRRLSFAGGEVACEVLAPGCFDGLDLVIVDVDDPIALEWAPVAAAAGAKVIDNSAAFRMDPEIPLVVAEVNPEDLRDLPKGIASCPNCTTMVLVTALAPLHRAAAIDRMVVSTYQSVSGAGIAGMEELAAQWTKLDGATEQLRRAATVDRLIVPGEVWPKPIAGNVIPLAGSLKEQGYTSEEWKLVYESRKILHDDSMRITATCVRVPVYVGHALSANLEFHSPMSRAGAAELLAAAPGVVLVDDGDGAPTPLEGAGIDPVLVGRLRTDPSQPNSLNLWVTGDNLRKGAALNAVQMAEVLIAG